MGVVETTHSVCREKWSRHSFIHLVNVLSTYHVPGTVPGAGNIPVKKAEAPILIKHSLWGKTKFVNIQLSIINMLACDTYHKKNKSSKRRQSWNGTI